MWQCESGIVHGDVKNIIAGQYCDYNVLQNKYRQKQLFGKAFI